MSTVVVVGGGAAGITAALAARRGGARVVLIERNARIGIKILISGGGRCNVTHEGSPRDLERGFIPNEARFLRHSLHLLSSSAVTSMLAQRGVDTYVRPNGRIFPSSERADDVLRAFESMLMDAGATVRTSTRALALRSVGNRICGVETDGGFVGADAVVVATGGLSYQRVGTTGDGVAWCRALGIDVEPFVAALAPVYFEPSPPTGWSGVSLRDVTLSVHLRSSMDSSAECTAQSSRSAIRVGTPPPGLRMAWRGDLLFTHRGMSGPTVLEVSRAAAWALESGMLDGLMVNCVPDIGPDDLRRRWDSKVSSSPRTEVQTFVGEFVPRALVGHMLAQADVPMGMRLADARGEERTRLLHGLAHWRPGIVGEVPIDRGEVTAGGIALSAVDPLTMRLRLVDGLYAAGETLDIAGSVGGYNLQAAFSTGWVAGQSAAAAGSEDAQITLAHAR